MADADCSFEEILCGQCLGEVAMDDTGYRCDACGGFYHRKCASAHAVIHVHSPNMEYLDISIIPEPGLEKCHNPRVNNDNPASDQAVTTLDFQTDNNNNNNNNNDVPSRTDETKPDLASSATRNNSSAPKHNDSTKTQEPTLSDVYNLIDNKLTMFSSEITAGLKKYKSDIDSLSFSNTRSYDD